MVSAQQGQRVGWQDLVARTVSGFGYDLIECERTARGLLRVTIDRLPGDPAGEFITVDDCEKVTRQLQYLFEVEDVPYERLEVSSPGLDRLLRHEGDYRRFAGQEVEITLKQAFQNRKKYRGVLEAEGEAWRLILTEAPPTPAPGSAGRRAAMAAAKGKAKAAHRSPEAEQPAQALSFTLDEVREARLVPVVDFKGRRRPAAQDAEAPAADTPEAGTQKDGGQES